MLKATRAFRCSMKSKRPQMPSQTKIPSKTYNREWKPSYEERKFKQYLSKNLALQSANSAVGIPIASSL